MNNTSCMQETIHDIVRPTASRAPWPRRIGVVVMATMFVLSLLVTSACTGKHRRPSPSRSPQHRIQIQPLIGKSGIYSLNRTADIAKAAAAGVDIAVGTYSPRKHEFNTDLKQQNIGLMDTSIQKLLYDAYCPNNRGQCHPPQAHERSELMRKVKKHVKSASQSRIVIGYYLTDDYRADMSTLLRRIYRILRAVDPKQPTACGVYMPLSDNTATRAKSNAATFKKALTNYSPHWCNSVMLYAYTRSTASEFHGSIDWSMSDIGPTALKLLRKAGWNPHTAPLIGVPQAFGYSPRIGRRGKPLTDPQYRKPPTAQQLTTQIESFCSLGAKSIIAYAWNDGSVGKISELYNSSELRDGYHRGVSQCKSRHW